MTQPKYDSRQATRADTRPPPERKMRNFTSVLSLSLVFGSTLVGYPAKAADITLDAGPGIKWTTASAPGGNPQIPIKKNDVLIIRQADPSNSHGFRFTGPGAPPNIPLCDMGTPSPGTVLCQVSPYNRNFPQLGSGAAARGEFLRLRALEDLPTDMPFECSFHGAAMKGTLKKS